MSLSPGSRLGPYEILDAIGKGGMGEVYRATDTRLKREVAIKVLPDDLASDPERLARLQREAQVLASLNHPNIATIYGLEDADLSKALVLELVEGPTLADRIAQSDIPVDEAVQLAQQIAAALDAAHEQGIIHRDLKPANVKIRPDGTVKVLDFGLAKAPAPGPAGTAIASSQSPTLTTPAATRVGVILGTAAYMSPEQARGRPVDKRADIWAFGCVLYEMLTRTRAFDGEDVTDTMGAVLHKEPDWAVLGADTPARVRLVLQRCLEKDPRRRLRDIGDVRLGLEGAFDTHEAAAVPTLTRQPPWRRAVALAAVALAAGAATGVTVWWLARPQSTVTPPIRFGVPPPPDVRLGQFLALSPDGRHLAFFAQGAGPTQLWVHTFETNETRVQSRAGNVAGAPFWSPDSRFIAYTGGGLLRKIDLTGGPPETVCEMANFAGGTWNRDDVIVFAVADRGLMRVPAAGGTPVPLTKVDPARKETSHSGPWFLPDGRRFLYLRSSSEPGNAGVYAGTLAAEPEEQDLTRLVATQQNAQYIESGDTGAGRLLFLRDGTLMAQPFDPARVALTGEALPVVDRVGAGSGNTASYGFFSTSTVGALAYRHASATVGAAVRVSRTGQETTPVAAGLEGPSNPKLSPDGRKLALIIAGDLWVYDMEGRPPIKLTFGGPRFSPLWTLDGRRIAHEAGNVVVAVPADGSAAAAEPMSPAQGHFHPFGWSADGREIVLTALPGPTRTPDILRFSLQEKKEPQIVVATPANEGGRGLALSPDGRWLAYASDETGQAEIWVRPYPGPGPAVRVSPDGGAEPLWAKSGRELYYLERTRLMAVAVSPGTEFNFKPATPLFESPYAHAAQPPTYDVTSDGRFLMIKPQAATAEPFNVVLNWEAGLTAFQAR
jgi:Tol biopolymer transport system component